MPIATPTSPRHSTRSQSKPISGDTGLKEIRKLAEEKAKLDLSKEVGKLMAQRAREKGIKRVVFDRGGYLYHGRVKAVAEAAREGGLEF